MNENLNQYFAGVNEKIIASCNQKMSLDIEKGKMGYCLYFFNLARLLSEPKYQKQAEKILDNIYSELSAEPTERSVYELAQIGTGVNCLIKRKFVEGNINSVLGDIDDRIFKKLAFEKTPITYRTYGIILVLYFVCMRIEEQKKESDAKFILEEIEIKLFNSLYQSLDPGFYDESILFNLISYKLPQFLFTVSKLYSLQFYNYRITEILREISGLILSRMPVLHANRLYLLWSLMHLKKSTGWTIWNEQMDMLVNHIDYQKIIYKELRNKDVFLLDGVAGIYMLLNALKDTTCRIPFDKILFRKRIEESEIWKDEELAKSVGLANGFSGLLWVYYLIVNEK